MTFLSWELSMISDENRLALLYLLMVVVLICSVCMVVGILVGKYLL